MPLALYTATAVVLLAAVRRWVRPLSLIAAAILFLLPFCFTGYALLTNRAYAPVDLPYATEPLRPMAAAHDIGQPRNGILSDVANQMIPWRKAVQWSFAHHQAPLWNPFILSGDILAAAAQPAAYSPFTWIACLLPVATSFTCSAAIAFFLASLGAFLFAREIGCSEPAAIIGAAAWSYSTDIAFFVLWPLGFAWAFLPFVLLGTRRIVREPSVRSTAILTIALTLMLLAGHPETALHVVFVGALYGVFEIAMQPRAFVKAGSAALVAGGIALVVSAIYLLPVLEALSQTEQHAARVQFYANEPRGLSTPNVLARLAIDFVPALHLAHWWNPRVNDTAADTTAVGSVALALAIYAIWRVRRREKWFFFALAVFAELARLQWWPVARLLQKIPLFDITVNERLSFAAAFSLAILAAMAIDELDRRVAFTAFAVLVLIAIANVATQRAHLAAEIVRDFGTYTALAEIAGLAAVALIALAPIRRFHLAAAILGVILVQRAMTIGDLYPSLPASAAYPPIPAFDAIRRSRDPFRVTGVGFAFIPNQSAMYELEDVRGYEAMTLSSYAETWRIWSAPQVASFNRVDDLTRPFLSFLNVKYAIAGPKYPVPPGWRVAAAPRGWRLLENTNAIERAFVPRRVRFYGPAWEAVNGMTGVTDFRDVAWISAPAAPERTNGPGKVAIVSRPNGYQLTADMENNGWIVVSEAAWKGWRAYVDGHRVAYQLANGSFIGVWVTRGHHRMKLVYKPQSFAIGRAVTIATLFAIAIVSIVRSVHHHRLGLE